MALPRAAVLVAAISCCLAGAALPPTFSTPNLGPPSSLYSGGAVAPLRAAQEDVSVVPSFAVAARDAEEVSADAKAAAAGLPPPPPVPATSPEPITAAPSVSVSPSETPEIWVDDPRSMPGIGGDCGADSYRASLILWSCEVTRGGARVKVEANDVLPVLKVPAGVKGLRVKVQSASAAVQVADVSGSLVVGGTAAINEHTRSGTYRGVPILLQNTGASQGVWFSGDTPTPLIVSIDNSAGEQTTVQVGISHDGLNTCPATPIGCIPYDADRAEKSMRAWSCEARRGFPTSTAAWQALGPPHVVGAGIPWDTFGEVWDMFSSESGAEPSSWMYVFKYLDSNADHHVDEQEFESGMRLCSGVSGLSGGTMQSVGSSFFSTLLTALMVLGGLALLGVAGWFAMKWYDDYRERQASAPDHHERTVMLKSSHENKSSHHDDPEAPHRALQMAAAKLQPPPDAQEQRSCGTWGNWLSCTGWRAKPADGAAPPVSYKQLHPAPEAAYKPLRPEPEDHEQDRAQEAHFAQLEQKQRELEEKARAQARHEEELRQREEELTARTRQAQQAAQQQSHAPPPHEQQTHAHHPYAEREQHLEPEQKHDASQDELGQVLDTLFYDHDVRNVTGACDHLVALAGDDESKFEATRRGAAAAVVQGMDRGRDDATLQVSACMALRVLCHTSNEESSLALKVARDGGIEAVLQAMRDHPREPAVQESACRALRHLALHAENRVRLCRDHGVDAIRTAMQNHPGSEGVQESGCLAIGNLAFEAESKRNVNRQLLQTIVSGMEDHVDSLKVVEAGVFALYNLICTAECFDDVIVCGGVECVRRAAMRHPEIHDSEEAQCIM
eukprot:CAMPEP_0176026098 /NCGR_PEP_ID=MMETSP0120_2-20121206/12780_1 /TAXON_ID=160619 /ORGANISM="Kryptoperidinium foliaceum, Strain CCMP 1326" /LENGTH=842 /DNA_ID=CAMNT_0017359293 /DNA_START=16 /DNA_END=2541 /DNA_ORIENTATION=+